MIWKDCATKSDCYADKARDSSRCRREWYLDWYCTECCVGDLCNYYVTVRTSFSIPRNFIDLIFLSVNTVYLYIPSTLCEDGCRIAHSVQIADRIGRRFRRTAASTCQTDCIVQQRPSSHILSLSFFFCSLYCISTSVLAFHRLANSVSNKAIPIFKSNIPTRLTLYSTFYYCIKFVHFNSIFLILISHSFCTKSVSLMYTSNRSFIFASFCECVILMLQ